MNRLFVDALRSIGLVKAGDNPEAEVVIWKSKLDKRQFTPEQREHMVETGEAMEGGGFPIANRSDLANAIQAFGRAADKTAAKRHIIARARALGAVEMLPESWNVSKVSDSADSVPDQGDGMDLSAIEDADLRKSVEDALAESAARISDLEAKVESLTPEPTPEDEIEKASPEVQAMIKEQQARTEKLEKELAEERRTRREAEYVEKAKPLSILLGKAEEVGPVLAELAEKAPEAFAKIEGALTAAAQRKELAALFGEMGSKGEGELDPAGAQAAYVEKQKAAGSEKTVHQLKADFWKTEQGKQLKEESRNG